MSINNLPDELLRQILSYVFYVPRNEFFAWSTSRQAEPCDTVPCSHVLLVSQRFLRIGNPLLYEAVRITNQDTSKVLTDILRDNLSLGLSIRWLRLEGGYGRELEWALKLTKNVDCLYFCPDVKGKESVAGIKRILPYLDPVHLWIERLFAKPNKHSSVLQPMLYSLVRKEWAKLKTISFEDHWQFIPEAFVVALSEAPALEEISICESDATYWLSLGVLETIAQNPSLKRIVCRDKCYAQRDMTILFECLQTPDRVQSMFEYVKGDKKKDRPRH